MIFCVGTSLSFSIISLNFLKLYISCKIVIYDQFFVRKFLYRACYTYYKVNGINFTIFFQRYYYYIHNGIDTEHVAPMEDAWLEHVLDLVPTELKVKIQLIQKYFFLMNFTF